MNVHVLFGSKKSLEDWGAGWLQGGKEHTHLAARNTSGKASLSGTLAKSLLAVLKSSVNSAMICELLLDGHTQRGYFAEVASHSSPGKTHQCWLTEDRTHFGIPFGGAGNITYHVGILGVLDALAQMREAREFWQAYADLLEAFNGWGLSPDIEGEFLKAADELYYLLRYRFSPATPANDSLEAAQVHGHNSARLAPGGQTPFDLALLRDPNLIRRELGETAKLSSRPAPAPEADPDLDLGGFVGWQGIALRNAVASGENCLLAGPTGTGKTMLTELVALDAGYELVSIEGKEGLVDLDFLGAILPQADGSRGWIDGPLLRAMRLAQSSPVLLFIDEINRVPREHVNLLLGLMNPKSGDVCRHMDLDVLGDGPFYLVEVPMTSELIFCPSAHLRIVAAGNFGRAYAVYDLDPAVRRRFDTVIEFEYLPYEQELELLKDRSGLNGVTAEALVKLAGETRRLLENGELPGAVDTASLLNWAGKCQREGVKDVTGVMRQARLTWADLVCGRDHTGRVNPANLDALQDYLESLGILPMGILPLGSIPKGGR